MIKPAFVKPGEEVTRVGTVFGTPLVVKGLTWLPLVELVVWGVTSWLAGRRRPERTWAARLGVGALTMPLVVGFEWLHNFAHAAAAQLVARPMDAMRITWGTPLVVYHDIEDPNVSPRQHIIRALGGPLVNALLLPLALVARQLTAPGSVGREMADTAIATNTFLSTVSLLPMPGIDGGPILKWSLVDRGYTKDEADLVVRKVNGVVGVGMGLTAVVAGKQRRWWLAVLAAQMAVSMIAFARGWIREQA